VTGRSRLLCGFAAILAGVVLTGCEPLDRAELRRQAGTVEATAAEGAVLAGEVSGESTKDTFVRVHGSDLADNAEHVAAKLEETLAEDEVPVELVPVTRRTINLALQASDALGDLSRAPGDAERGELIVERLQTVAAGAGAVVDAL
jgi:hypothetical protein